MVQYTKEKMHQWYLDHKAQHNENVKRWKREHPEYFKNRVQMSAKKFNQLPTVDDKLNYLTNYNLDVTDIRSQLPNKGEIND
jgi:hypothetical protein